MEVMSNGRVRRTEREWRDLVSRFQESGLRTREFCRKEEVQVSSLLRWQQKLLKGPRGASSRKEFVEVVAAAAPLAPAADPGGPWTVEVTLPNGSVLRLQG